MQMVTGRGASASDGIQMRPPATLCPVDVMRQLERRLEAVLDRAVGQFFRGTPHVAELAGSIVRVLDLAVGDEGSVPNRIVVPVPSEPPDPEALTAMEDAITRATIERGWRLEGPVKILPAAVRGVSATFEPGTLPVWATLEGPTTLEVRHNRSIIGRSPGADVVVDDPSVSRRHALLWRQDDRVLMRDLESANGTTIDSTAVGGKPVTVPDGSLVTFGMVACRVRLARDA
jgi:hypothetical protein